ncbi:glucosaminidase domain-containing protein [Arcicella rigui]|uniref:Glucosaminidase domain-containing protein n=1 Tax=Arcicella rigui TaxID=797020 RepID=A0ABU5Q980_9BACT|nr:glucosaminidase domain-containing protein [Arcicella rigui]MEA5139298.1 glucosaminidase domain-containing protein [Arcicella rigui]
MARSSFPNQVISILFLGLIFFAFTNQKLKRIGLNVEYTPTAQVGEEVRFHFNASDEIYLVRIYSDNQSLGTAKIYDNSAELSFPFTFTGTKRLRFVAVNDQNETSSEVYGELVITGKVFKDAITVIPETPSQEYIYTPKNQDNSTQVIISNPNTNYEPKKNDSYNNYEYNPPARNQLNVNNFKFKPTPNEDINGRNDNVYSTAIGHPNADDVNMFFDDVQPIATELARKHNVPASVIMAMAALESGYGFSRNAIFANNLLGIKQWKGNPSNAYQLKGQPDENDGKVPIISVTPTGQLIFDEDNRPDNWYKRFNSREECLRFLVEEIFLHKTGVWKRDYSEITRFYQKQIAAGIEKYSAAYTFCYGIGEYGYTHRGGKYYADRVMKIVEKYNLTEFD